MLGEYYFWKRMGVFVNLRNVGDATEDTEILGPSTPEVAQFRQRIDYAALWTIGIKGTCRARFRRVGRSGFTGLPRERKAGEKLGQVRVGLNRMKALAELPAEEQLRRFAAMTA